MTAATLHLPTNHAERRADKTRLYADVLAEIRATRGYVWHRELRDESLIVGHVSGRPMAVLVKVKNSWPRWSTIDTVNACFRDDGIGCWVSQPGGFEFFRRWSGR